MIIIISQPNSNVSIKQIQFYKNIIIDGAVQELFDIFEIFWRVIPWIFSWKIAIACPDRDREILNSFKVFLQRLSPNRKKLLHDKLECATLFSSKASYPSTIPHIYKNDYLGMHAEAKWLDIRNKNQFSPSQVFIGHSKVSILIGQWENQLKWSIILWRCSKDQSNWLQITRFSCCTDWFSSIATLCRFTQTKIENGNQRYYRKDLKSLMLPYDMNHII